MKANKIDLTITAVTHKKVQILQQLCLLPNRRTKLLLHLIAKPKKEEVYYKEIKLC